MSPEVIVMRAPRRGYALLKTHRGRASWLSACVHPAKTWIVLGASLTIAGTGHIAGGSFVPTLAGWAIVPIAQVLIALIVIRGPGARAIGRAQAFDLFFVSHAPWSLWLIAFAVWGAFVQGPGSALLPILVLAIVPIVWTAVMVFAYCREVLDLQPRDAGLRVLFHQGLTWGLVLAIFGVAVQIWPRVLESFAR